MQMEASETRARRALSSKTTEKETLEIVYEDICKEVLAQREVRIELRVLVGQLADVVFP